MGFSFFDTVLEELADMIARHHLEVVFHDRMPRWRRIVLANQTHAVSVEYEPPDGYIDLRYGRIALRAMGSPFSWNGTTGFGSFRKFLYERGVNIPAGLDIWQPPEIKAVLSRFAREAERWDGDLFG